MILNIKVKPYSGKQEIIKISETNYQILLKSLPENKEANIELLKLLKRYFKTKEIKIISGRTSRDKRIEIIKQTRSQ